ncbi:MAG: hypothetical protein AAF902_01995 [Chloroflexota bacterium]
MSKYSNETKAAVMAALLEGQSVGKVAKDYKIPEGTVSAWKYRQGTAKNAVQKNTEQIGELLLGYLNENLITLKAQSKFFRQEEWLRKQHAADAAVLHGVLTDKSIRLLEALSANKSQD